MVLDDAQLDKVSEITGESYAAVQAADALITAGTRAAIVADIVTWDENRNAVDFEMDGEIKLKAQKLLDKITERTRLRLGFASLKAMYLRGTSSVSTYGVY